MEPAKLDILTLLETLEIDSSFLKRIGGKDRLELLYFKKSQGFDFSREEQILYFESHIFLSSAYQKKYGRGMIILEMDETLH